MVWRVIFWIGLDCLHSEAFYIKKGKGFGIAFGSQNCKIRGIGDHPSFDNSLYEKRGLVETFNPTSLLNSQEIDMMP